MGKVGTAIGALVFLIGCRANEIAPNPLQVDTLASGVVHVQNAPLDPDRLPVGWAPREIYRIGADVEADPETLFGRIRSVAMDVEGTVYVLDDLAREIRAFDPSGQHMRTVGRRGNGPGEFETPNGIVISQDSVLWVRDSGNRRYTALSLDGRLLGTHVLRSGAGTWAAKTTSDGMIWEPVATLVDPEMLVMSLAYRQLSSVDGEMVVVRTVERDPPLAALRWSVEPTVVGGVIESGFWPVPFTNSRRDQIDPERGVWTGVTSAFHFTLRSLEGDTLRIVERSAAPRPVLEVDRSRAVSEVRERFGPSINVDESLIPEYRPQWDLMLVDASGSLWVRRFEMGTAQTADRDWEIYDADGTYLGVVPLPFADSPGVSPIFS